MSNTEYTWLLGDTNAVKEDGLDYVLKLLSDNKRYDAIIVNGFENVKGIPEKDYTDRNQLLYEIGWYTTFIACLIASKSMISLGNFKRYYDSLLVHTGIIFEYIADKDFLVHWIDKSIIYGIQSVDGTPKKHSWTSYGLKMWFEYWPNFVFSLPYSYNLNVKLKCIKDISKAEIFSSLKGLFMLRSDNLLNYKIYKQYSHSQFFPFILKYPKIIILFISILPIKLILILGHLYFKIRK
jgi:hypothetical protein